MMKRDADVMHIMVISVNPTPGSTTTPPGRLVINFTIP
jgi:hypothetical protein